MSVSLRLFLAALLALVAAGCDSSLDAPDAGSFTAEVRGNAEADLSGRAAFTRYQNPPLPPDGGFFSEAVVVLEGLSGEGIEIGFYEMPHVRRYPVESPTTTGAVALVGATVDGDNYGSGEGSVTVTRVTDTEIEGEFDVSVECCGNCLPPSPAGRPESAVGSPPSGSTTSSAASGPTLRWRHVPPAERLGAVAESTSGEA